MKIVCNSLTEQRTKKENNQQSCLLYEIVSCEGLMGSLSLFALRPAFSSCTTFTYIGLA